MAKNENKDGTSENQDQKQSFETFDEYLATVDQPIVDLYKEHTSGLKSALEKERDERKELSEKVKALHSKAEKGSDLEQQLSETLKDLEAKEAQIAEAQKRMRFVEQATTPEIGCVNPKAAWAIAATDDLFDRHGEPDWDELKKVAPQLFRKTSTDAGKNNVVTGADINAEIRRKAGFRA